MLLKDRHEYHTRLVDLGRRNRCSVIQRRKIQPYFLDGVSIHTRSKMDHILLTSGLLFYSLPGLHASTMGRRFVHLKSLTCTCTCMYRFA